MKQIFYFLLVLGSILNSGCIGPDGFVVRGTVEGMEDGRVYAVRVWGKEKADTLMSAGIKEGKFLLEGQVEEVTPIYLSVEGKPNVLLFLEEAATFDVFYSLEEYPQVKGGGESQRLSEAYDHIQSELSREYIKIQSEEIKAFRSGDMVKLKEFRELKEGMIRENEEKQIAFLYEHGNSFFALYQLWQGILGMDAMEVQTRYDLCSEKLKATFPGKEIARLLPKLQKLAVGATVPDFVSTTPDGKDLSLYDVKSKVKLIDFWASNCGICREENRSNVALYNRYHAQGFEIISYSLDKKKEAWLRAIREDGLPWTQVSDLGGVKMDQVVRNFGVYALPTTLLVDENNRVIARNIKSKELAEMLPKLLAEE